MNNIIRNVVMLPFLSILVASMTLGFQYSNQALGTETKGSTDTSSKKTSNVTNFTSGGQPPGLSEKTSSASLRTIVKVPLNAITCFATAIATSKIRCVGTDGNDNMTGDNGINNMYGKKGNDLMSGRGADDYLFGDEGNDRMNGATGNDRLYGYEGDDGMNGDVGNDVMYGGPGADTIQGGIGDDKIYHSNVNDPTSPDHFKDTIDCGGGNDEVWISRHVDHDTVVNCETEHYTALTQVTFDSITVHNKHEGGLSGDGEYYLVAYVQGRQVDLTAASGPGAGLRDVSNGETLTFRSGTRAHTVIPYNIPLSVFTVGHELDACSYEFHFPDNIQERLPIFSDPGLDWSSEISKFQHYLNFDYWVCLTVFGDDDEVLGKINELYYPPNYGAGRHELKSSSGDFTLRYTIKGLDTCGVYIC